MHAHIVDLDALLRRLLAGEVLSETPPDGPAGAVVQAALRWTHQSLRGRKAQPLVLVSPDEQSWGPSEQPTWRAVLQALALLPVATLQGTQSSQLAWGLTKTLQSQGARVSLYGEGPLWWQMVGPRSDWTALFGRKQVRAESFYRDTEQPAPARVPQWLALSSPSAGLTAKQAQALLSRYGELGAVLTAAQDFMGWSAEPAWAQGLSDVDRQKAVLKVWASLCLGRRPDALEQAQLHWGRLDELALAEHLQDTGALEGLGDFLEWVNAWEKAAPARADCLQVSRAWSQTKSDWPGVRV